MFPRHPRHFYKPLVTGAPTPYTPQTRPSDVERMIHFAGMHDPKMAAKAGEMLRTGSVDVLLGNFEDAVPVDQKPAARTAFVQMVQSLRTNDKQAGLWIRTNQLGSTMFMEDMEVVRLSRGWIDVVMIPKVESAADILRVDWLLAQIEAAASFSRPIMIHAILETAEGVERVLEIASASPRMHGMSLGPADLAADRGMKTTRVGGPHPDYGSFADAEVPGRPRAFHQGELWHFTTARLVDACRSAGIKPFYGPYGDFKDLVGCEAQFRNAAILGCDGSWTLHPTQVEIARRVFSPDPKDLLSARRIVAAMPDGTGAVMLDGKMQDDATWKQAMVFLVQAEQIVAKEGETVRIRYFDPALPHNDPRIEPRTDEGRASLALALTGQARDKP